MNRIILRFFMLLLFCSAIPAIAKDCFFIECSQAPFTVYFPDFDYEEKAEDESIILKHTAYSHRKLIFTQDISSPPSCVLTLQDYSDWFVRSWEKDDPSLKLIEEEFLYAGEKHSIPFIRKHWQMDEGMIHQLYFTYKNCGYCIWTICYPPKNIEQEIIDHENDYWKNYLINLTKKIK